MGSIDSLTIIVIIAVIVLVFFLFREINTWYWKINERLTLLKEEIQLKKEEIEILKKVEKRGHPSNLYLARRSEFKGNIPEAIDYYLNAFFDVKKGASVLTGMDMADALSYIQEKIIKLGGEVPEFPRD